MLVKYASGPQNTLTGFHTIDEAKLQDLPIEEFNDLKEKGFLAPIYSMLISIYQLNALIRRQNAIDGAERIAQVSIEPQTQTH